MLRGGSNTGDPNPAVHDWCTMTLSHLHCHVVQTNLTRVLNITYAEPWICRSGPSTFRQGKSQLPTSREKPRSNDVDKQAGMLNLNSERSTHLNKLFKVLFTSTSTPHLTNDRWANSSESKSSLPCFGLTSILHALTHLEKRPLAFHVASNVKVQD